jgi:TP901 family phage tail tape measure protein
MPGMADWQAKISIDIEDLKKRIKVAEGELDKVIKEDRKIKLDFDTKTLESAIQKLDKMLDSLGKGTGDFKQLENLSKELSAITSEVKDFSKAFGKLDDTGAKTLLSSIQNIDKSLFELSQNILNVNKNMSNMGGNTSGAVKQVENITNESKKAASALEDVAKAQEKVNGQKTNISSGTKDAFQGNGIDNSKEQLAIDKQLTKELESQAKAQQKKWKSFQKENEIYQKKQSEVEAVKRNKDAYEELANAIKQYSEVSKRVSGGKAEDVDIEKMTQLEEKISQLQKQPILSDSQVAKSESALVSLYDQLDKIEKKLQETNQKQVDSGFSKFSTYQGKVDKYQATIDRFNDGGWTSSTYLENVQAVKNAVKEYETLLNELKGKDASLVTSDEINKLDNYEKKIKDTIATVTNMSASEKGYNFVSGQKELDKIHKLLNENSKMSSDAKAKIKAYYAEIESGNPSMSLDKIHGEILKIYNAEVEAGRAGRTLWDTLKNSGFHQIAAQMAGMFGVYDVINVVRQGVNTVRELDTAMTEVRKVSNATESQYDSFKDTISSTAKEIATTNKELLNSSADFLRLGYSLDQASDLAKNATLFVNVGDGVDITEATEDMITAMKAFDIKAEDSIKIVDDYNQIGNQFALSASDIGEAMKRSASALEVGNNSFEEGIGMITAMNEIVQDAETTGTSLKVLSLRLRGAKADLKNMGEDTDGLAESTSKLREQIKALSGVDIMVDDNTFKSTAQQVKELGAVFNNLSDSSQAALLEIIAGKSRSNAVAALLKNYQQIDNVVESLGDAEGSAMRENEAIVDSINGRIKVLSATAEEFWQNFIDTDLVKKLVSLTSDLLNILTKIVNIGNGAGTLGLIGTGAGIFKFIKNFDWVFKPYTKLSNSF